jgi:uncharacterized protein involved in exopolysaccharide biosynthesis
MDRPIASPAAEDEITFREFLEELRRAKVLLICLMLALAVGGALLGYLRPKEYEATTVLMPATPSGSSSALGGLAQLASDYGGGLASLAGMGLPGSSARDEAIAVLQSELLTQRYIEQNRLLPVLYAAKWDSATGTWKVRDPKKIPTLWLANRYFKSTIRTVIDDKKTGTIDMTIKWKNPQQAADWANGLVQLANSYLRNKEIQEAESNIAYLNGLVAKTNVVQEQEVIYALMQQQIEKAMIARDREEYALKVVDPAFAPDKPASAGPMLMGILGLTLGVFFGVVIVFIRRALRA